MLERHRPDCYLPSVPLGCELLSKVGIIWWAQVSLVFSNLPYLVSAGLNLMCFLGGYCVCVYLCVCVDIYARHCDYVCVSVPVCVQCAYVSLGEVTGGCKQEALPCVQLASIPVSTNSTPFPSVQVKILIYIFCVQALQYSIFCAGKDVDLYLLCANFRIFQTLSFLSIPFLEVTGSTGDQITFILAK